MIKIIINIKKPKHNRLVAQLDPWTQLKHISQDYKKFDDVAAARTSSNGITRSCSPNERKLRLNPGSQIVVNSAVKHESYNNWKFLPLDNLGFYMKFTVSCEDDSDNKLAVWAPKQFKNDHVEQLEVSLECANSKGTLKISLFGCIEYIATNIDKTEQELYVAYNDKLENGDEFEYGDSMSAAVFLNGEKLSHSTQQTCTKVKSVFEYQFSFIF